MNSPESRPSTWFSASIPILIAIWCATLAPLFITDVWDETNALIFFDSLHEDDSFRIYDFFFQRTGQLYRPIPFSLSFIVSSIIDDNHNLWKSLRVLSAFFVVSSVLMLLSSLHRWFSIKRSEAFLITFAWLFSGPAIITATWFANLFDGAVCFFSSLGIFALSREKWSGSILAFGCAFFCKEIAILIVVPLAGLAIAKKIDPRKLVCVGVGSACFLAIYWLARLRLVGLGSPEDIHGFDLSNLIPTVHAWIESFWWQNTWRASPGILGIIVLVFFVLTLKKLWMVFLYLSMCVLCVVIYMGTLSYNDELIITSLMFIGRLYLFPTWITLFLFVGFGRRSILLIMIPFILIGAYSTHVKYRYFQMAYQEVYTRAWESEETLIVHFPPKPLSNPGRNLVIGDSPDAAWRLDPARGLLVANERGAVNQPPSSVPAPGSDGSGRPPSSDPAAGSEEPPLE
jgi:hypothetical protein